MNALTLILIGTLVLAPLRAVGSPYAVIVHRSNATENIRWSDLKALFSGSISEWPNHRRLTIVQRDPASPVFRFLLEEILNVSRVEYKRKLVNLSFQGEDLVSIKTLNTESAACKFVYNVPGSIAIVEASSASSPECTGTKVVRIEGKLPGDAGYKLQ